MPGMPGESEASFAEGSSPRSPPPAQKAFSGPAGQLWLERLFRRSIRRFSFLMMNRLRETVSAVARLGSQNYPSTDIKMLPLLHHLWQQRFRVSACRERPLEPSVANADSGLESSVGVSREERSVSGHGSGPPWRSTPLPSEGEEPLTILCGYDQDRC